MTCITAGLANTVATSVFSTAALRRDLGMSAARTGPKDVGRLTRREQEVLALRGRAEAAALAARSAP